MKSNPEVSLNEQVHIKTIDVSKGKKWTDRFVVSEDKNMKDKRGSHARDKKASDQDSPKQKKLKNG